MKHLYFVLFGCFALSAQAQIINFPDPDFKAAVLNDSWNDADGDGEISQQEAANVAELILNGAAIDNLEGLQYFTGLSNFYLYNSSVTGFVLPPSTNYNDVYVGNNPLLTNAAFGINGMINYFTFNDNDAFTNLNLPGVTSTNTTFSISGNGLLATVNLPAMTHVGNDFTISDNPALGSINFPVLQSSSASIFDIKNNSSLSTLDLSEKTFLFLTVENNGLTSVNLNNLTCDFGFSLANNQLESLDLSSFSISYATLVDLSGNNYDDASDLQLYGPWATEGVGGTANLKINNTQLTSLSFGAQLRLSTLTVNDNLLLETINFRNGKFETCQGGYCAIQSLSFSNNPALNLVCTDAFEGYALEQANYVSGPDWVHQHIDPNVAVSVNCFYDPPGTFNSASGLVRYDLDGNGCSASDPLLPFVPVATSDSQVTQNTAYANGLGGYYATTSGATLTLTPSVNTDYFTVSPASANLTFTGFGSSQTADFCVSANGSHHDLAIDVISMDVAIAGFDTKYRIIYRNQGTTTQAGTVAANFWTTQEFLSASVSPTSQTAGNLTWDFTDLKPFETRIIDVTLNINGPTDTPPINSGNTVSLSASVTAAADETMSDNNDTCLKAVANSFDPNDKQVSQGDIVLLGQTLTDGLTYTIRFQNTGTANAQSVVITDFINGDFNLASIRPIASSHAFKMRRKDNLVEFWFEEIDLPYESANEPASHGFVTYTVKSNQAFDLFSVYENTANIYFDYNLPIVTNTTQTTVVELGTPDNAVSRFKVYPNPASNLVNVSSQDGSDVKAVIYNLSGQLLLKTESAPNPVIDVSKLSVGTYLLKLSSANGSQTQKLIRY
ncbi:T9SS type A sorting domain-containing protein [Flavobacterium sp.]|uniref:T9SS type A sorting domain-containing protein n=1 Tax=Flavobacterium sp. TaxID=239 RepID=UPI0012039D4B|nr:T9SS type A sorting domain-containing protein [Flavobacterium sp.]RZJ73001.1 MAG: T9SS type A sorting domain-containing protein [Flavobacterium sp.]